MDDKTRLSYWYPKLETAGLPVPRTIIVPAARKELDDISGRLEGKEPTGAAVGLTERITMAANTIGYPFFLRTDFTSGKHDWKHTCFVSDAEQVESHVVAIVEHWEMVNMFGPPSDMWAVRELLPTIPIGHCRMYGNMPICREFRFFVEDGYIRCWHPYWPWNALTKGDAVFNNPEEFDYTEFSSICTNDDEMTLKQLASKAGAAVGGAWSVDLLETRRGWFITDMAEAHKSFHIDDCPFKRP